MFRPVGRGAAHFMPSDRAAEFTPLPQLLTRKQIAALFSVRTETVKRRQRASALPALVLNSRVTRYQESDVARLMPTRRSDLGRRRSERSREAEPSRSEPAPQPERPALRLLIRRQRSVGVV